MQIEIAIIGGTGVGAPLMAMPGTSVHVPTPEGTLRGKVIELKGRRVFVASRHSAGHKVPPHKVGYRALALGMQQLGVHSCFATAAVGSLRTDWPVRTYALCTDFIDDTGRRPTLFDRTVVHTPLPFPFHPELGDALQAGASLARVEVKRPAVYVCANGPRYETPHEIRMYRQLGGDVVGMTAASEAILMAEAGVRYACLSVVTNLGTGLSKGHDHGAVTDVMVEEWANLKTTLETAVTVI